MTNWRELNVDHGSAVPLHVQLQRQLRSRIVSGQWKPGTRLPSENRMQQELNISRNTARQALRELENERLIERIPGRGTFVAVELPQERRECLVAIVISHFETELTLLSGAEQVARDNDCLFVFNNHHGNYHEERRILGQLSQQSVSGVLLWSSAPASAAVPPLVDQGISLPPLVLLDRDAPGLASDFVTSDNVDGAGMAVQHLQQLGHRRIVCLSHDASHLAPVAERIQGYQAAMEAAGMAEFAATWELPTGGELSRAETLKLSHGSDSVTMRLLRRWLEDERPQAIFAINDYLAMLALSAARFLRLQVPGDLSIVGFDNIDYGVAFSTPLTTVAQDYEAMGRRAMEMLLERMEGLTAPPRTVRVPVTLQVRATTGKPADPTRSDNGTDRHSRRR